MPPGQARLKWRHKYESKALQARLKPCHAEKQTELQDYIIFIIFNLYSINSLVLGSFFF